MTCRRHCHAISPFPVELPCLQGLSPLQFPEHSEPYEFWAELRSRTGVKMELKVLKIWKYPSKKKKTQKINSFKELQWQNLKVLKIKMYIDLINLTTFCSIKQEWQNSQMSTKWDSVQLKYKFNDPKPIKIYSTFSLNIGT